MYSIELSWKEYNVSLPTIEDWISLNIGETYVGSSADSKLTLWFASEPSDAQKQLIQDYWDGLTDQSSEATSYVSRQSVDNAITALRVAMVSKTWDQLTVTERKLVIGLTPTNEELGL